MQAINSTGGDSTVDEVIYLRFKKSCDKLQHL